MQALRAAEEGPHLHGTAGDVNICETYQMSMRAFMTLGGTLYDGRGCISLPIHFLHWTQSVRS